MKTSTRTLLAGFLAASIVLAAGVVNTKRLNRNAENTLNECYERAKSRPTYEEQLRVVTECDYQWSDDSRVATRDSVKWTRVTAAIIAILGALPWAWHFLLRRIVELRDAIAGHPPSD